MDETCVKHQPVATGKPNTAGSEQEVVKASMTARKPLSSRKITPAPVTRAVVIRLIDGVKRI